jgi:FkbM family methyltransferase
MSTEHVSLPLRERGNGVSPHGFTDFILAGLDAAIRGVGRGLKSRLRSLVPGQLREHRIWSGPLRGLSIVTSWRHYHTGIIGTTEPGLLAWFGHVVQPGESWLDIGANYGYTALALRRLVGTQGRVFAFEPKLSTCGCLSQTMLLNGLPEVTVIPVALGSPETLELKQLTTVGGMVAITPESGESAETIVIARLDWLWPRICGSSERMDGVKIDVQGMELEVLQGMKRLLKTYRPKLAVELHAGVDRAALLDLLESCGYVRRGRPIYFRPGEEQEPQYYDNFSYAFTAP